MKTPAELVAEIFGPRNGPHFSAGKRLRLIRAIKARDAEWRLAQHRAITFVFERAERD